MRFKASDLRTPMTAIWKKKIIVLASVVQRLDSAIHRINLYPVDSAISLPNTYPLDSDLLGG